GAETILILPTQHGQQGNDDDREWDSTHHYPVHKLIDRRQHGAVGHQRFTPHWRPLTQSRVAVLPSGAKPVLRSYDATLLSGRTLFHLPASEIACWSDVVSTGFSCNIYPIPGPAPKL